LFISIIIFFCFSKGRRNNLDSDASSTIEMPMYDNNDMDVMFIEVDGEGTCDECDEYDECDEGGGSDKGEVGQDDGGGGGDGDTEEDDKDKEEENEDEGEGDVIEKNGADGGDEQQGEADEDKPNKF
jgi:hypothetical protein